jgi:hypothetical protein
MQKSAFITGLLATALASVSTAQDFRPNTWFKIENGVIEGNRWDVPLGWWPEGKRFVVLGGRSSFADYKKPRSYDVLALDDVEGAFENLFPKGKKWGPRVGPCEAPRWKNEYWQFQDDEGNTRPNWTVYGTFSLGQKYDYDSDTKTFFFYARGKTFRYNPASREWIDLAPENDPEKALGGVLLWSSMCYDRHNKQFVLFGGGNVQSKRGDPGTWTYTPATNTWKQLTLDIEPPQRANSRLVYDPANKQVVLFGGDRLDQLTSDTWTFDVVAQKWQEKKPAQAPSPRGGHALVWLAKAKKILLIGGYELTSAVGYVETPYRPLPADAWAYDVAANRWTLVKHCEPREGPELLANFFTSAAANEKDEVVLLDAKRGAWVLQVDASLANVEQTKKYAVAPGAVQKRSGPHDPAWYREDVPAADPAKVAADLKALPANEWVQRPTPKLPRPNMDWGSAAFSPELDLIIRFSGGHSAYSGTAPQVYGVKTDRYSIPFAPELPLEYVFSNDQVHGEWSFQGNPWMTGHTYKSTGYDPNLKCLVFAPHEYLYFFDPLAGKWSRSAAKNPYQPDFYNVTVCATPAGAVVWGDKREGGGAGLWRIDSASRSFKALPLTGTLPQKSPDQHGLAYDSARNRLLFFSRVDKNKGNVTAYDFKSGEAKWLDPAGQERAANLPSRETVYIPEFDLVLIGARIPHEDKLLWAAYDCAKNAWLGLELSGADPIGKGTGKSVFNNSMGLMYDPHRKLVWTVGQNSHVHVLRLEMKSGRVHALGE